MKKKLIAASVVAGLALTLGGAAGASAHDRMGEKGQGLTSILTGLVSKGTLTQTQADAITKALTDARGVAKAAHDAARAEHIKVITDTLGIDAATLKSRLDAGDSLATIAGAKKDALITALVAVETKRIDAAVTAGKLTAERATEMKSKLQDFVTKMVERKPGMGKGPKGIGGPKGPGDFMGKGHGRGGH
jgi:polyhydroxyalkanoate synthesis regulator phasin